MCAGDESYASGNSLVGSIGVITAGAALLCPVMGTLQQSSPTCWCKVFVAVWRQSVLFLMIMRASGFGLMELAKKLGLERRVFYAGKFKDMLDPFRCEMQSMS